MNEPSSDRVFVSAIGKRNHVLRLLRDECLSRGVNLVGGDATALAPARNEFKDFELLTLAREPNFEAEYARALTKWEPAAYLTLVDPEITALGRLQNQSPFADSVFLHPLLSTAALCEDKYAFHEFMTAHGIPTIPTFLRPSASFPQIRKDRRGSAASGFQIFQEHADLPQELDNAEWQHIYQPFCGDQHYCIDAYFSMRTGQLIDCCAKEVLSKTSGESYLLKSAVREPFIEILDEIARVLPLRGIVNLDIYGSRDNMVLMEINSRIGGNYPAAHAFGTNLLRHALDEVFNPEPKTADFSDYKPDQYVSKFIGFTSPYS